MRRAAIERVTLDALELKPADLIALRRAIPRLVGWYRAAARELPWRETSDPYAIWISEVMLQQTQVQTALPYYQRWLDRFPSIAHLARAEEADVLRCWQGLGYYSRARNLHRAAKVVLAHHQGQLPASHAALAALPGVGEYTAAALASIAFSLPHAVVDGNVRRVLCRLIALDAPPERHAQALRSLAQALLDPAEPALHNQAMMELGALICRPRTPRCLQCPFGPAARRTSPCAAHRAGEVERFPRRKPRKKIPHHHYAVGLVERVGRLFFCRRPYGGLLAGMWDFPNVRLDPSGSGQPALARRLRRDFGLEVKRIATLPTVCHTFSHLKVTLHPQVFRLRCEPVPRAASSDDLVTRWVGAEMLDRQAMPRATLKVLECYQALGRKES